MSYKDDPIPKGTLSLTHIHPAYHSRPNDIGALIQNCTRLVSFDFNCQAGRLPGGRPATASADSRQALRNAFQHAKDSLEILSLDFGDDPPHDVFFGSMVEFASLKKLFIDYRDLGLHRGGSLRDMLPWSLERLYIRHGKLPVVISALAQFTSVAEYVTPRLRYVDINSDGTHWPVVRPLAEAFAKVGIKLQARPEKWYKDLNG